MSSSSRSSSPTKPGAVLSDVFKPNPHPYAIKTTSTGILSRSSSSVSHSHNHYVPASPSPSPTKAHYSGYSERGSSHRYSRSLTEDNSPRPLPVRPEDVQSRSRANSLLDTPDEGANPKLWDFQQLAENVPEIADFVREHEITGRAFLRFDDGVLDAYGVSQQWQRSLILSHSRRLRQSIIRTRIWPNSNDTDTLNTRLSHSRSTSPSKYRQQDEEEDDPAYLSSSSSVSSVSSFAKKRRHKPNGRVHGMVASFERSASPDKAEFRRDRSDSTSSVEEHWRPLPLPPQPTGEFIPAGPPLILPQTSFPNSFPQSFNTPQSTGQSTPHATGNGNYLNHATPQATGNSSRPLPATPLHPSLRPPPVLDDSDEDEPNDEPKNASGEMTMDELIAVLDPDTKPSEAPSFVNTDRRKVREKNPKRRSKGAAAWEMDIGETVKHIPPISTLAAASTLTGASSHRKQSVVDDEMSVEELLALEGGGGAAAWVDEPEGIGRTMKRVGDNTADGKENSRLGSLSKGRSIGRVSSERISLSAGRKSHGQGKKQARRVGELFTVVGQVEEVHGEEKEKHMVEDEKAAEIRELRRMEEVERQLLCAEEEERLRWVRQAEEQKTELQRRENLRVEWERKEVLRQEAQEMAELRKQEELRLEEERRRQESEERLRELFQRQKRMEEETRRRLAEEAMAKERREKEEAAAEKQRQLDAEERLASSITENRRLLEEFRGRLEKVEQGIEELQAATTSTPAQVVQEQEDRNARVIRHLRTIAAWALSTPLGAALPRAIGIPLAELVRGHDSTPTNTDEAPTDPHARRGRAKAVAALYPKSASRYALLFGIGVCAFMLRGLVRWGAQGVRGMGSVGARGVRGR